ncbi:MAG: hypothetical protein HYV97_02020 [Bdellovibrio sp.]|nr:hypothetical protein [Bdellovibrio sp.]
MKRILLLFLAAGSFLPYYAFSDEVNVSDYKWKGSPVILKTSQVFSDNGEKKNCGSQNYEICVGAAELKTPAAEGPNPAIVVKCFIPKNQTACPSEIKTTEQCYVATVGAPANPGARPKCKIGQPQNDNLTFGCNCHHYGRPNDIRPTAAQCKADKDQRDREYRDYLVRLCPSPYTQACKDHCAPTARISSICVAVRAAVVDANAAAHRAEINTAAAACGPNGTPLNSDGVCQCNTHYVQVDGVGPCVLRNYPPCIVGSCSGITCMCNGAPITNGYCPSTDATAPSADVSDNAPCLFPTSDGCAVAINDCSHPDAGPPCAP